ncbi:hemagglutinin repeat-containing protein, partial [Hydrogenophaga sp. 2FB]|uniref:hemagglutinin repeat-containing protein n=1 Tax=Hydrogenophaga sp. 2FB TaxID=2502187 RepID=UPI0010F5E30B
MSGDVLNSGTIAGRQLVQIDAARDISHSGKITTQGTAALSAGRDIAIAGGEIAAKDAIVLDAGRDLNIASTTRTTTTTTSNGAGTSTYERTGIDRQAKLYVSGEAGVILAQAGRDITLTAADIRNEGSGPTAFVAGRDLNMDTVRTSASDDVHWNENHRQRTARSEETGTRIAAGGDVHLQAGQHLVARAVDIQAQGDIHAKAAGLLLIDAGERALQVDEHHHTENKDLFSSKSVTTDLRIDASEAQRSRLQGRNVILDGGATFVVGADIEAREDIHIRGATVAQLHAAQDTYSRELEVHVRRKLGVNDGDVHQSKTEINELTLRSQAHGTSLKAGNAIRVSAPDRIELQGARLEAPDIYFAGGEGEGAHLAARDQRAAGGQVARSGCEVDARHPGFLGPSIGQG